MAHAPSTQPYVTAEGLEREGSITWTPKNPFSGPQGWLETGGVGGVKQERQGSVAGAVFEGVSGTDVHWGEIGMGGFPGLVEAISTWVCEHPCWIKG